jgi:hypothetical protein
MFYYIKKSIRFYREFFFYSYLRFSKSRLKTCILIPSEFKAKSDYDALFFALNEVNENNEVLGGTRVLYKGYRSTHGYDRDSIEGSSRFLPYLASYILTLNNNEENYKYLVNRYNKIINNGIFDEKYNWGNPEDYDQLICEAADIALSLWISKKFYWNTLNREKKDALASWLKSFIKKKIVDNNWYLFILTIEFVLKDFGYLNQINEEYYLRIKSFYTGDGWFKDGPSGEVDLYSVWAFNYSLFWISQIDTNYDSEFIKEVISCLPEKYEYLFNEDFSFVPFSRSKCYRLAISIPFLTNLVIDSSEVNLSRANAFLCGVLEHYIKNGCLDNGRITQGLYKDDIKLLDSYSGPASPLWSIRPLVIANYLYSKEINVFKKRKYEINVQRHHSINIAENIYLTIDDTGKSNLHFKENPKKSNKNLLRTILYLHPYR